MSTHPDTIVIPSSSPEQNWARSVSPCTPERLFGISPRGSSPISLPSPSELSKILRTNPRANSSKSQSPLREDIGKANLPITIPKIRAATTKEKNTETREKDSKSSVSKPKTTRSRKSAKPETGKNKTITGRVAKSTFSKSKFIDTNEDTPIDGRARTSPEEVKTKKNVDLDDLNLEEAINRRLDWTPPKPSPFFPADHNNDLSQTKPGFGGLLHDYRYSKETDVTDNLTSAGAETNPTKRRRIELVDRGLQEQKPRKKPQRDLSMAADSAKEPENRKAQPVTKQKKAKTITALVTSRYETVEADAPYAVRQQSQPSGEQSKTETTDDSTKKKKKTKKVTAKPKEPEYIILSPDAVTKSLNNQDLLFGTCSQLETDDHPTVLRETQRALAASENYPEFDNLLSQASTSVSPKGIASRFTGSKSLWSAATRNSEGFVVQPEVLDMTNSPEIRSSNHRVAIKDVASSQKASMDLIPNYLERAIREASCQKKTSDNSSETRLEKSSGKEDVAKSTKKASTTAPEMPRYSGFTDDELRKQITSYGFKSVRGRNKMIALLEKCWQSKQSAPMSTAEQERTKNLSTINEEATEKPNKKQPATTEQLGRTSKPKTSTATGSQKPQKKKSVSERSKTPIEKTAQRPISVEEIPDSEEEPEPIYTRIQAHSKTSTANITTLTRGTRPSSISKASPLYPPPPKNSSIESLDLSDQITKALRLQPRRKQPGSMPGPSLTWHEKILLYDPVLLEDLATWLNTEGLGLIGEDREVGAGFVRQWCESKGVCCTYRTK